jgi:hypothetical protein
MPNRRAVEIKMCEEYAGMLQMKDASKVLVISRKLRVGEYITVCTYVIFPIGRFVPLVVLLRLCRC